MRPIYWPRNCGYITEGGLWREGEMNAFMEAVAKVFGHIRQGDLFMSESCITHTVLPL